jgi:hypothetical protein
MKDSIVFFFNFFSFYKFTISLVFNFKRLVLLNFKLSWEFVLKINIYLIVIHEYLVFFKINFDDW